MQFIKNFAIIIIENETENKLFYLINKESELKYTPAEVRLQGGNAEDVRPSSKRQTAHLQLFLPLLVTSRSNGKMGLVRVTK